MRASDLSAEQLAAIRGPYTDEATFRAVCDRYDWSDWWPCVEATPEGIVIVRLADGTANDPRDLAAFQIGSIDWTKTPPTLIPDENLCDVAFNADPCESKD